VSGHFRLFVVDGRTRENVRILDFEVPEHREPIALGVGPDGNLPPQAVHDAAAKLLKKGEAIDQIVHLAADSGPSTPSVAELEAQIARLQAQLEAAAA
jgi:hypothetical protein